MPKLTLSTSAFFPNTERSFRAAAELGYDGVELMVSHDRVSQSANEVRGLMRKYGVEVLSVHSPCLAVTQHVWGWNLETKLRRSMQLASDLDAEVVVVHPPFRWQKAYAKRFPDLVHELHNAGGAALCVENMYTVDAIGKTVNPYLWTDDPSLPEFENITLDTSHAAASGWDPVDLYKQFDGRVQHLHLSDSHNRGGDEHLAPGHGNLDLEKLGLVMGNDDYTGHVVLEIALQRLPEPKRFVTAAESRDWTAKAFGQPAGDNQR